MIKINFIKPELDETKDSIALYNMKISEKFKKTDTFGMGTVAWLKNNPERNYQDLELELRKHDFITHLIAKPLHLITIEENLEIGLPNSDLSNNFEYVLIVSCKPKDEIMAEIKEYHLSYEDNFNCLKQTGCLKVKKDHNLPATQGYADIANDPNSQILNSERKFDMIKYDGKTSINIIIEDLIQTMQQEPEKKICGEFDNKKVYGLVIDNKMASPIGWIDYGDDVDFDLIDFRTLKKIN